MHQHGVSQSDLSRRANVNHDFVSRLLNGHLLPNVADLANIASVLGISLEALIYDSVN